MIRITRIPIVVKLAASQLQETFSNRSASSKLFVSTKQKDKRRNFHFEHKLDLGVVENVLDAILQKLNCAKQRRQAACLMLLLKVICFSVSPVCYHNNRAKYDTSMKLGRLM